VTATVLSKIIKETSVCIFGKEYRAFNKVALFRSSGKEMKNKINTLYVLLVKSTERLIKWLCVDNRVRK